MFLCHAILCMASNFLCVEYNETKQLYIYMLLEMFHNYNLDLGGMDTPQESTPITSPCHTGKVDIMLTKI